MENFFTDTQVHGYTLRKLFFSGLFMVVSLLTFSQGELSTQSKKARKLYEKADKKYKERSFYEALDLLEESAKVDPAFFEAHIRMGSLYKALGQEDSVYSKYQAYFNTTIEPIASVIEKLAHMAFDRGEYVKAQEYLNQFLTEVPERSKADDIVLLSSSLGFAQNQIENYDEAISVDVLTENINRFKLQYLPSITIDNSAMFFTKRDHVSGDEDIVVSYSKNDGWLPAQSVSQRINSHLNEGACSVSADGRIMIFTSCDKRDSYGSCDLYITKKTGENWSKPKNLGRSVNSRYWESQPSLSADGKTLYFSSNRSGGKGGRDLWVSKNEDGKWIKPTNLGDLINTPKDETTPFIHPDGETLYFSANGYPGMGGYDLYKANLTDSIWSQPQNIGYPINTHKDEVAIIIASDGVTAYFAKEEQKNFEILDSKIVSTRLKEEMSSNETTFIIGKVMDAKSHEPLRAEVQIVDLLGNKNVYLSESDSLTGVFYMILPKGLNLAAYVKKKGYLYADYSFESNSNSNSTFDTLTIELDRIEEGQSIVLQNVYFDFDSYELKQESESEIENAYQMLVDNPSIIVEIAGHTDNIGSVAYNLELSTKRANIIYQELIKKGIEATRITYKGYGQHSPKTSNDSDESRQSNRRIEFRVLRKKR